MFPLVPSLFSRPGSSISQCLRGCSHCSHCSHANCRGFENASKAPASRSRSSIMRRPRGKCDRRLPHRVARRSVATDSRFHHLDRRSPVPEPDGQLHPASRRARRAQLLVIKAPSCQRIYSPAATRYTRILPRGLTEMATSSRHRKSWADEMFSDVLLKGAGDSVEMCNSPVRTIYVRKQVRPESLQIRIGLPLPRSRLQSLAVRKSSTRPPALSKLGLDPVQARRTL